MSTDSLVDSNHPVNHYSKINVFLAAVESDVDLDTDVVFKDPAQIMEGKPFFILLDSMGSGKEKLVHKIRQQEMKKVQPTVCEAVKIMTLDEVPPVKFTLYRKEQVDKIM